MASAAMPGIAHAQDAVIATTTLPRDLSPWGMYLNADPVVKAVLIGLALASVITWTVCLAKAIEIFLAKRDVDAALNTLASVRSPAEGVERLAEGEVRQLLEAAVTEEKRSAGAEPEGVKGRIALRLERIEAAYGRRRVCARRIVGRRVSGTAYPRVSTRGPSCVSTMAMMR